jgi:hypothetical protein
MAKPEDVESYQSRRYRDLVIELNGEAHDGYNRVIAVAHRRVALGRILHIASGLLALLSGSAITGVATKVLDATSWQTYSPAPPSQPIWTFLQKRALGLRSSTRM